ncbi:SOUL family heme-binding protein [Arenimonas sp.]|uniref:SOUL family heme-binding protein n=1 Tax=Arenimonas sp. TaxID=1872635 RepID=UPI0037C11C91
MSKFALLGLLLWSSSLMAIEQPKYTVLKDYGDDIEMRQYDGYIIAETEVAAANADQAGNLAFKRLGGYIFGGNRSKQSLAMTAPVSQAKSEKIEMTAPVNQVRTSDGVWLVSFVMPKSYTLETLPVPNDPEVYFKTVPARKVMAIRFSGRWTETSFTQHESKLLAAVKKNGLKSIGSPWTARYDPPFMPGFMRRNEVMIELR